MNQNLRDIILNVEKNQGKLLNLLIDSKIVDLELATAEVMASNDAQAIYYFARYINGADKDSLEEKIINTNDPYYICEFACLKGVSPEALINKIISLKDGRYIYYLARNLKSAPIEKLTFAMLNTNDPKFIYFFLMYVPNVPIKVFINHLMNLGSYEYIARLIIFYEQSKIEKDSKENPVTNYLENHYLDLLEFMKTCSDKLQIKKCLDELKTKEFRKVFKNIYLNTLNEEEKLKALKELYINNDFETIRENRNTFQSLFQNSVENKQK